MSEFEELRRLVAGGSGRCDFPGDFVPVFAALDAATARAEAAERRVQQILALGAIPVEDVAHNVMRSEELCQARHDIWDAGSHARLTEALQRARVDGANASLVRADAAEAEVARLREALEAIAKRGVLPLAREPNTSLDVTAAKELWNVWSTCVNIASSTLAPKKGGET